MDPKNAVFKVKYLDYAEKWPYFLLKNISVCHLLNLPRLLIYKKKKKKKKIVF